MTHRILLVDDEPNVLAGLQRSLRRESYEIFTATSAKEGLNILKEVSIDVVVSDQEMSGMSGTAFLRQVHNSYPETVTFMLTGKATLDVAVEAINQGAITRFLTKPCNDVDLAVTIRQALEHKDLMTEARRLLMEVRRQDAVLASLERESPGITHVTRDSDGAILLDEEDPTEYNPLIEQLRRRLDQTGP